MFLQLDLGKSAELFVVVLDMLSTLLLGMLVPDERDGRSDARTYHTLVRRLKVEPRIVIIFSNVMTSLVRCVNCLQKELGDKQSDSFDLVRQLLQLPKPYIEVLQMEPHKSKKLASVHTSL